jgi:membrane-associated phospholipid phosphatase
MNLRIIIIRRFCLWLIFLAVILVGFEISPAQTALPAATPTLQASPTPEPSPSLEKQFFKNILRDQQAIWTSPFRLRGKDIKWLAPLGAATAGLIATDRRTSAFVSRNGSLPAVSRGFSQGGSFYATGGVAAGLYLIGGGTNNRRMRETGLLAGEALIDSGIVTQGLKFATQRPRPNNNGGRGRFFTGGNSFPSGHATSVWSHATVIAYEYQDRPLVRYGAFAAATAVSLSRYTGRNHFLSDVLIGGAIGYGIGRLVYRKHHVEMTKSDDNLPPKTSKLMPLIIPIYERRAGTYGGTLVWNF